ncbi:MAG TPA: hypothetical protein VFO65_02610 [Acidimicrobiales bacterium]|nr:hypothetical protein [Acidimicrobiales bacterium]
MRTGGIAGFFCRQRYEVTVEVGDDPDPGPTGGGTAGVAGEADADWLAGLLGPAAAAADAGAAAPAADDILALAEQVNRAEEVGLSTSGSSFSEVLARLTAESAIPPDLESWTAGPSRMGASLMAGGATASGIGLLLGERGATAHRPAAAPAGPAAPAPPAPPADGDGRVPPTTAKASPTGASPTAAARVAAGAARAASAGAMGLDRAAHVPLPVPTAVPGGHDPGPGPGLARWAAPAPLPSVPSGPSAPSSLAALGVPEAYLAALDGAGDLTSGLQRAFSQLPEPPSLPVCGGAVLAVVGDGRRALALARDLAAELGLEPADVLLASPAASPTEVPAWLCIPNAAVAAERRRSWRRRPRPVVVAVESAGLTRGQSWARHVLDALEPSAVWAVVHAGRKTEDVAAWADALGGVDVLAVEDSGDTTSPAAVLGVGVPVGRLDGRAATPARWAALLAERLAA